MVWFFQLQADLFIQEILVKLFCVKNFLFDEYKLSIQGLWWFKDTCKKLCIKKHFINILGTVVEIVYSVCNLTTSLPNTVLVKSENTMDLSFMTLCFWFCPQWHTGKVTKIGCYWQLALLVTKSQITPLCTAFISFSSEIFDCNQCNSVLGGSVTT